MQCSLWAQPGLAGLRFPQNLFLLFAGAHLGSRCPRPGSIVPLHGGGSGDSPLEQGQDRTLCDITGVYFSGCHHPSGLQTPFFFLNCHNLGSMCGLRHQTSVISISKLNCPSCRGSVALLRLLVKPAEGRGKTEGFAHWKCRLSLLFRWSDGRNVSESLT